MASRRQRILGWTAAIALASAYVIGSEVYYLESNKPTEVRDIRGYFNRFGEPSSARIVTLDGQTYYELAGHRPNRYMFAHPSSPPAYIFDASGKFVEWCYDPGDVPSHYERWPQPHLNRVEFADVRQRFGF